MCHGAHYWNDIFFSNWTFRYLVFCHLGSIIPPNRIDVPFICARTTLSAFSTSLPCLQMVANNHTDILSNKTVNVYYILVRMHTIGVPYLSCSAFLPSISMISPGGSRNTFIVSGLIRAIPYRNHSGMLFQL